MIFFFAIYLNSLSRRENPNDLPGSPASLTSPEVTNITGSVKESETLFDIFKKHGLDIQTLYEITSASKKVYNLAKVKPSHAYLITTLELHTTSTITHNDSTLPQPSLPTPPHYLNHHSHPGTPHYLNHHS
ncbi:MAG: hypothetical protein L0922_05780, partial [Candidatus Mariimomonas ferrooxydans]